MKRITNKEIRKKLKLRLNSQRRIFNFDNKQILVLPILEHPEGVDNSIDEIKFYIDEKGGSLTLKTIKVLKQDKDGVIVIEDINGKESALYFRKMDGSFDKVINYNFSFSDLTIDHSPSIYTVLFMMYLNKRKEYLSLNNFFNDISNKKMTTNDIKAAGFKGKVENALNSNSKKHEVLNAYKVLFSPIELEIIPKENNNANLSKSSLEFYYRNRIDNQ